MRTYEYRDYRNGKMGIVRTRYLCECTVNAPFSCNSPATQEDMLCDNCRKTHTKTSQKSS